MIIFQIIFPSFLISSFGYPGLPHFGTWDFAHHSTRKQISVASLSQWAALHTTSLRPTACLGSRPPTRVAIFQWWGLHRHVYIFVICLHTFTCTQHTSIWYWYICTYICTYIWRSLLNRTQMLVATKDSDTSCTCPCIQGPNSFKSIVASVELELLFTLRFKALQEFYLTDDTIWIHMGCPLFSTKRVGSMAPRHLDPAPSWSGLKHLGGSAPCAVPKELMISAMFHSAQYVLDPSGPQVMQDLSPLDDLDDLAPIKHEKKPPWIVPRLWFTCPLCSFPALCSPSSGLRRNALSILGLSENGGDEKPQGGHFKRNHQFG